MKKATIKIDKIILDDMQQSIKNENTSSITPQTEDLVDLAIELWRLEKKLSKTRDKLSEDENKALDNSLNRLKRFINKNNIETIDYTGQFYNEGMNVDILHIEKVPNLKQSIIFQTHEPAASHLGKLVRKAKVIVHEK